MFVFILYVILHGLSKIIKVSVQIKPVVKLQSVRFSSLFRFINTQKIRRRRDSSLARSHLTAIPHFATMPAALWQNAPASARSRNPQKKFPHPLAQNKNGYD